jgi:S-DNA-T family DNA segregation ATPase FtsK/SpoIIIE
MAQFWHPTRVAAGTLTGHAVGDDVVTDPGPSFDLLADLNAVMATHGNPEPRSGKDRGRGRWLWSESAVGALEVLRPDVYTGWDAAALGKALAARGVPTTDMFRTDADGERRNLVGFNEAGLRAALDAAGRRTEAPDEVTE